MLVARIPPLRAAVGSIVTGLQSMPSVAWVPFAIVLFGENTAAILFVVILGAAPSIANGLITGVDYTPPLLLRAGQTMGLRGVALYRYLILPASLPAYVAGLKQGWAFAWRSLMAAELFVSIIGQVSIGQLLNVDQQNLGLRRGQFDHHRDPGHRHRGRHPVHQGRPVHPPPPRAAASGRGRVARARPGHPLARAGSRRRGRITRGGAWSRRREPGNAARPGHARASRKPVARPT